MCTEHVNRRLLKKDQEDTGAFFFNGLGVPSRRQEVTQPTNWLIIWIPKIEVRLCDVMNATWRSTVTVYGLKA